MSFNKKLIHAICILFVFITIGCTDDSAETLYPANDIAASAFYNSSLKPIIEEKCISCHIFHLEGTNRYDTFEKTKSSIGQMLERINATSNIIMPPADSAQLTEEEKAAFEEFLNILTSDVIDNSIIGVTWTAYKYPVFEDRASVNGTFDGIEYSFNTSPENPEDILKDAEVLIDATSVSVNGNEEGTTNLKMFFSIFTSEIAGKVIAYTDSEATINFTMNGVSIDVILDVVLEADQLILKGSIPNMDLFNWQDGYDALDNVCGEYHENKVWADIDIEAKIKL